MVFRRLKIGYALLQLLILLSAHVGWQVHVYTEELSHFAAHCIDRTSNAPVGNGGFAEDCPVCHFHFFAGICADNFEVRICAPVLHRITLFFTASRQGAAIRNHSLRAPPACRA